MNTRTTRAGTKRAASQSPSHEPSHLSYTSKKRTKSTETSENPNREKPSDEEDPETPLELLKIEEEIGDIFDAPANTLIIHACNCLGHWGAGIAKAFKDRYPRAHGVHEEHCEDHSFTLMDHAQLIPPVDAGLDDANGDKSSHKESSHNKISEVDQRKEVSKHFVGCLFTSRRYGRQKDTPKRILAATKPAMEDLLKQVNEWNVKAKQGEKIEEVRMCKINSGLFAVPWEKSKKELESIDVSGSDIKTIKVVSRAEE